MQPSQNYVFVAQQQAAWANIHHMKKTEGEAHNPSWRIKGAAVAWRKVT
jgi:hypothetical protein